MNQLDYAMAAKNWQLQCCGEGIVGHVSITLKIRCPTSADAVGHLGRQLVLVRLVIARFRKMLAKSGLKERGQALLSLLSEDPLRSPPAFERLVGDLSGAYSRRINIQHRLVYEILADLRIVRVLRMWTHYE
jgi:Txe/YoeB family toxin of toxin-antitoxin system